MLTYFDILLKNNKIKPKKEIKCQMIYIMEISR